MIQRDNKLIEYALLLIHKHNRNALIKFCCSETLEAVQIIHQPLNQASNGW